MDEERNEKPLLYEYFRKRADVMLKDYDLSADQEASANLGKNREYFCNEFLSGALPSRLRVVSGEARDALGHHTGQLDLMIVRDDCPVLPVGYAHTYLAEGLFAVIEVKSNLTTEKLKEAAGTLQQVASLEPKRPSSVLGAIRLLHRPLRLVFAYEGATWRTLIGKMDEGGWSNDLFDLISVLRKGVLLRNNVLLEWDGPPFQVVSGPAAALGFLYYYLVSFGVVFQAGSVDLQPYFQPFDLWAADS